MPKPGRIALFSLLFSIFYHPIVKKIDLTAKQQTTTKSTASSPIDK